MMYIMCKRIKCNNQRKREMDWWRKKCEGGEDKEGEGKEGLFLLVCLFVFNQNIPSVDISVNILQECFWCLFLCQ